MFIGESIDIIYTQVRVRVRDLCIISMVRVS